jgi:Spy/CpxP family protein refolding chaperone
MTFVRFSRGLAIACSLTLGAAGVALAQDAPPPPPPPAHGPMAHPDHAGRWGEHKRGEHERLLHDALALRPDQEAAWTAFKASMEPTPEAQARRQAWAQEAVDRKDGPRAEHAHLTTPERLDKMAARMAERQAAFQRHAAAVKTFYAVLTPQQQRTFDALATMGMHSRFGPGMGQRGG